jgi:hypothetical protein
LEENDREVSFLKEHTEVTERDRVVENREVPIGGFMTKNPHKGGTR